MCRKHRDVEKEVEWNKGGLRGALYYRVMNPALLSVTVQSTVIFFFNPSRSAVLFWVLLFFFPLSHLSLLEM